MCIIFFYLDSPIKSTGDSVYKLVVAANRDEFLSRPATQAHFWDDFEHVLAGQDQAPGKEGGTWLGMCKDGRIGFLTNYKGGKECYKEGRGRGTLLADFFCHQTTDKFQGEIEKEAHTYSAFNLVAGDAAASPLPKLSCFTCDGSWKFEDLSAGVHCISNGSLDCNWDKVVHGKKLFTDIIDSSASEASTLIDGLIHKLLLRSEKFTDNDSMLEEDKNNEQLKALSSIFVQLPNYGTRANTVILVDQNNNVTFHERSMVSPIDPANPKWTVNEFRFQLDAGMITGV